MTVNQAHIDEMKYEINGNEQQQQRQQQLETGNQSSGSFSVGVVDRQNSHASLQSHGSIIRPIKEEEGDDEEHRVHWASETEFLLSCIGYAVGIGNIWRFPYLCFSNGGGAFLIPYFTITLLLGVPMFMMEVGIGQYFQIGPSGAWKKINPHFQGLGIGSCFVSFIVSLYYNVIIGWCLYYLYASCLTPLPWTETFTKDKVLEMNAPKYFVEEVIQISDSINDIGDIVTNACISNFAGWVFIFFVIFKGVESAGKVVYVTATFPYFVLLILVLRGVFLDGAMDGLRYYIIPDWEIAFQLKTWLAAGLQVFYSLGIGWGSFVAFASHCPKNHDFVRTAYLVPAVNAFTSLFAGIAVFSIAGYVAKQQGVAVADLSLSGTGLAFELYPTAMALMPWGNGMSILFFIMMFFLGVDSQFAMCETYIGALKDQKIIKDGKGIGLPAAICIFGFLAGMIFATEGGYYILNVVDGYSAGFPLFLIVFLESIAVSYIYGIDKFQANCEEMLNKRIPRPIVFCWRFISPLLSFILVVSTFYSYFDIDVSALTCKAVFNEETGQTGPTEECTEETSWAIQVAVGLVCLSTSPIVIGCLEPFFNKEKENVTFEKLRDYFTKNNNHNDKTKEMEMEMEKVKEKELLEARI